MIILIFILVGLTALAFTPTYESANVKVFENPSDPTNSLLYFLAIIVFTAIVMILTRKSEFFLKLVMYSLLFISAFYIFYPFFGILSIIPSSIVIVALLKRPNTLTINISAFLLACGITAMFGISLEPIPVLVLLIILAVYDFVAVYTTKHMIDLAESVVKLKLPLLFIIPTDDKPTMLGVGDVVIPNILTVSAQTFLNSPKIFGLKIPALTTLIGGALGLTILLIFAEKFKRAHAGLPFINSGAILGFLIGCMIS
ncbi:presenilin family intramembrane aspartyl protease PSH [Archaeoglobus profundus]|uniref:Signal-peptide peptidase, presenilin aspartyl protease n=1 Tax=Archaeoglobus profundus (strain DSM 5631 / JCM 9629 / NBRC 100127 / Av18) TaxID=572546 RepID=D2REP6_ARCPA|nr:presenilin family intramembrane aspartyl protease PSH [Archaeoglobus profundus]ADB58590.1 Protein of unknown function DUF1119 [Archaeoglobus profundus DSM 5631]